MACIYIFKGHKFSNELELDDFLLEKYQHYGKYKDLAFSSGINPMAKESEKLENLKIESLKHWDAYLRMKDSEKEFDIDGDGIVKIKEPYKGVTKYLSLKKDSEGNRLYPEFILEEYWKRKFKNWGKGIFDKIDQEIWGFKEKDTEILDEHTRESMKKEILKKWDVLARIGDAVHAVLQLYFSEIVVDGERKNVFNLSDPKQYILDHIDKKHIPYLERNTKKNTVDDVINCAIALHEALKAKCPGPLRFFPEYVCYAEIQDDSTEKILGFVDLIVVDGKGRKHIIDYKTSIKDYADFNRRAKTLAYKYLMATYQRMLLSNGINTFGGMLWVAPIKINGFVKDPNTQEWVYSGILLTQTYDNITEANMEPIYNNIDSFLPPTTTFHIHTDDAIQLTEEWMKECFDGYTGEFDINEESTKTWLEKTGRLKPDENGVYNFKEYEGKNIISDTDPVEFVKKVTTYRKNQGPRRIRLANTIKKLMENALSELDPEQAWPTSYKAETGESVAWLKDTIAPYCNGEWEIFDNEAYEQNWGIITLINKSTKSVDFIRISTSDLKYNFREHLKKDDPTHGRLGLTGQFETDAQANSKSNSLVLESVNGNIELMEMMAILNHSEGLEDFTITKMAVVNPYDSIMITASSKELEYNFNELNKFKPLKWNKFQNGEIKLANMFEYTLRLYKEIMEANDVNHSGIFSKLKGCTSALDDVADGSIQEKIKALLSLALKLESDSIKGKEFNLVYKELSQLQLDHIRLYNSIMLTIANLKGINFRQQIEDHGKWFLSIMIHSKGLQGSYIDNPGNLTSETLNLITKLVTEAYQNTRDEVMKEKVKIDKLVKAVKEEAGFGYILENIGMNLVNLYKDMFEELPNGDLVFVKPETLSPAKRALLEYALEKINKDRYGDDAEVLKMNGDMRYYRVPLARGSLDSVVSTRGLLSALRNKLKEWNPQEIFKRSLQKLEGLNYFDSSKEDKTFIFKMTNMFDCGNESLTSLDRRLQFIKNLGIEHLERNVETLLLKHIFAYSLQRNIDTVFPLIKASAIHLQQQGANQNSYFEKDLGYIKDYVWGKILNRSILSKQEQGFANILTYLKLAASKFSLAFAPVQFSYLLILGLWQNISLMIRKPDGTNAFTFKHFVTAYKIALRDMFDFSGKPTLCLRINELYALNDMDMNSYIDRITKNKKGLYNFDNMLFKFAARPDYYNRIVIFLALMLGDGCLNAHYMEGGELKYDWKKDKRFEAFANNRISDPDYNKQKMLYYAIASQFEAEHVTGLDGEPFTVNMNNPKPLPRAYTNKLAEGMKNLADDIYGYYSHEKKSLIMSTTIGSLWMQFKTFWSGKKNQYLQGGKIRLRGNWEHYTETNEEGEEVKWYYKIDGSGNILYDLPPIPDKKPNSLYTGELADTESKQEAPVMQWKGQWLEGILLSVAETLKDRHVVKNFKELWTNADPNLQRVYRSNMKQLAYDMFMFFIVGTLLAGLLKDWYLEQKKESKKSTDIIEGLNLAALNIAVMSVKNSFMDLNMFTSIGEPIGQWTPFAFQWWGRTAKRFYNACMGEDDWYDTIVKSSTLGNQIRPLLNTMKPNSFRNALEGGTWQSSSTLS